MRRHVGGAVAGSATGGFTIVELVAVITIMAILASVAGPRFFAQQPFVERGYADQLAGALRYAQKIAVASGCPVRVAVAASSYVVRQQLAGKTGCDPKDATWPVAVLLPDGSAVQGEAAASLTAAPTGNFTFDAQGRLSSAPAAVLTLGARRIVIDPATGFVEVQ